MGFVVFSQDLSKRVPVPPKLRKLPCTQPSIMANILTHSDCLFPTSLEVRPAHSTCFSWQTVQVSDPCHCGTEVLAASGEYPMLLLHILVTMDAAVKMEHPLAWSA